ncbi:MAG TPA: polysaccharide biosynthesis protein [Firmicutes bacterium]|nr:polysaccharide biosynthesis protein [Bacillota bacterium]
MTRQSIVRGAAILTLAALFVRIVGAFFRIALAALIKDEGVGLYQMAYPVYSTLLAISTAGIPTAISKLVSENLAHGNYRGAYRAFRIAQTMLAVSGLVIFAFMFFGANIFISVFRLDPRAYLPVVAMSPAVFFVTLMSAYRGFFQGQQQMLPTALSQITEQLGRVVFALVLVLLFLPSGLTHAAAGASSGAAVGAFLGLAVLLVAWWRQKKFFLAEIGRQVLPDRQSAAGIVVRILSQAVPITLGSLVLPLISLADLVLVPQRLAAAGFDSARATELYGQLTGLATPLVHIPTIMTTALAVSLVPAISEALALGRSRLLQERAYLAVRVTLLLGIPCAAGLYLLADPICLLLYNNGEAGSVLSVLALGVVFLTLYQTTSGILQGVGRTMDPVVTLFWGAVVKTVLTWLLAANPAFHIRGAALATVLGFAVAAILNLYRLQVLTGMPLRAGETLLKPLAAACVMGAAVYYLYHKLEAVFIARGLGRAGDAATCLTIAAGVCIYFLILLLTGGIKREDLLLLPKAGPRLAALAEKLHLIRR